MTNLPDLDTLTPEELEKLADEAREGMGVFSELWLIISEAKASERLAITIWVLLRTREQEIIYGPRFNENETFLKACKLLEKIENSGERISFAIAVLEGLISDCEDDEEEEEEEEEEIKEALDQGDINKAFQLAVDLNEADDEAIFLKQYDLTEELRLAEKEDNLALRLSGGV